MNSITACHHCLAAQSCTQYSDLFAMLCSSRATVRVTQQGDTFMTLRAPTVRDLEGFVPGQGKVTLTFQQGQTDFSIASESQVSVNYCVG